jgi:hypothetical protein
MGKSFELAESAGKLAFLGAVALFQFFVGPQPTYPTTVEPLTVGGGEASALPATHYQDSGLQQAPAVCTTRLRLPSLANPIFVPLLLY